MALSAKFLMPSPKRSTGLLHPNLRNILARCRKRPPQFSFQPPQPLSEGFFLPRAPCRQMGVARAAQEKASLPFEPRQPKFHKLHGAGWIFQAALVVNRQ